MTSDDEIAGLIAHNIAQGVNSFNGVMNGQFFWTKEIFNGKANELKYDKQAVDYMVKAGYNPVAIITAYDKVGAEWRGVFWGRHQKVNTRMNAVYNQIKTNYPKYLGDNAFTKSDNYARFIKANNL